MTLDLKPAFSIAVEVHGSQVDRAGEPYMWHVCRVAMAGTTPEEQVVGVLHDAIEDAEARAIDVGHAIYRAYGVVIGDAVVALTRQVTDACLSVSATENTSHTNYIQRLSANPLAVKVKLADLQDNMRPDRLAKLPEEDRLRLLKKYEEAYAFLSKGVAPHE